jgi:transposase
MIVFIDEVGFGFLARLATTWAPVGKTPVLTRTSGRRELSTFVCLTLSGKIYKRHFGRAIRGEEVVEGLRHLRRHLRGPIIIVWDRLRAHSSAVVKRYLATEPDIYVEQLPPYAPDLNPEEQVHGNVKRRLGNANPINVAELRTQVDRGFARLRNRPDMLLGFIRHSGLKIKQLW